MVTTFMPFIILPMLCDLFHSSSLTNIKWNDYPKNEYFMSFFVIHQRLSNQSFFAN